MTERHSVLERRGLYCPAPILSGQASYGDVLKAAVTIGCVTFGLSLTGTMILMGLLKSIGVTSSLMWMLLMPVIITFLIGLWLLRWTRKRRDVLVVLKEALDIEKRELRP